MTAADGPIQAAGAVVWRTGADGGLEVCVVHRPKYDDWSLPKGKLDPGEHVLTGAVREVLEETGHGVVLGRPLPTQHYPVGDRIKEVRYWAAPADHCAPPWAGTVEIDRLDFLPVVSALERLTHERDRVLVAELAGDPTPTTPVVLLRHSKARSRTSWPGPDQARPLDRRGFAQADRLAVLLGCFGVARVVSSDALRCVETVRPYAVASRTIVELEPGASEEVHETHPEQARELVRMLIAAGRPTVVCSHRPVLPDLVTAATARARCPVPQEPLAPGGFLVLHHRDGDVVAAERHDP